MVRSTLRSFLFLFLSLTVIAYATSGIQAHKKRNLRDFAIKVPGRVVEKNIETLVRENTDRTQRMFFDIFPDARNADDITRVLPLAEGFNNAQAGLPEAVKPMWRNALLLLGAADEGAGLGTGFVVRMKAVGSSYKGYIITNHHVIEDFCNYAGDCPDLFALHDIGLNAETGDVFRAGPNVIRAKGARVIQATKSPDLALLEVDFDRAAASFLTVATIKTETAGLVGQAVYAIGYPATFRRTSSKQKPIADQNLVIKRWSSGTAEKLYALEGYGDLLVHNADILPGNSGSGLYNSAGNVVGVNVLMLNSKEDFDYNGGGCGVASTVRASIPASLAAPFWALAGAQ